MSDDTTSRQHPKRMPPKRPTSETPAAAEPLLTAEEHRLIVKLGECACDFSTVLGPDREISAMDAGEFTDKVHQLQHTVMAQAAARAYPDRYRLLGVSPVVGEDTDE